MGRGYVLQRVLVAVVQVLLLAVLVFLLTEALPGDAATVRFGEQTTLEEVERLRERLELDRPAWERFADWLGGVLTGDLGTSLVSGGPVGDALARAFPVTLVLTAVTLVLVVPLAVLLGVVAGLREGGRLDRALTSITLALQSIPDFVLATLLVALLAVRLRLLPATAIGADAADLLSRPELLVLPVVVLLARVTGLLSRQVRAGVVDAARSEYVAQARRLGLPRRTVVLRHVLPNAAVPAVQELARVGDGLLGGVLVVEAVFAVPGVATEVVEAVQARDVPVVQSFVLLLGALALVVNLGADLLANRLVPRAEVLR
ncbi:MULTISPECIES: ABC transporter permease [Actinosynnema]|uniref:ABC transporter permease n=1 Tax=Actinosynnema TaxID=40566 RepID=UPI0020A299CE|nr:ABC transporter permease [Actinosynnema pretiosum]MCP2098789.1 peptide/nickel transport system permease protein [Actinosynnema pretiosum]